MLQLMGGIRALFKCLYSTEIDKDFKSALWDLTGIKCLGYTFRQDYPEMHRVALASITTECPDYASNEPQSQRFVIAVRLTRAFRLTRQRLSSTT